MCGRVISSRQESRHRRSRDGVRGRDGALSSFLGASRVAIRPISRFFFQLRIRSFMPRWCFRCVLLRAKEETLRLAKLDRSSHGATADGSSGLISVAITKPTKEISQSNHSGSHAGTASLPDRKIARTRLGTRYGRSSGARLENGIVIPHIPHGVRREPSDRPCEMIRRNRAGRESLAKFNIGSGSLIQTVIETVHELLCGGVGCPPEAAMTAWAPAPRNTHAKPTGPSPA
jgi:hypothetical protein